MSERETTREQWLVKRDEARAALRATGGEPYADIATEAILGPLPPEPAPEKAVPAQTEGGDDYPLWVRAMPDVAAVVLDVGLVPVLHLRSYQADAMADALRDCAQWLRENRETARENGETA